MRERKLEQTTIDGGKLCDCIAASNFNMVQLSKILGRGNTYIKNATDRGRIAAEDLRKICIILGKDTDDFIPTEEPAKEEPKQLPVPAGDTEQRLLGIETRLAEIADVLERIANYTSQSNAKLYRLCEEWLK